MIAKKTKENKEKNGNFGFPWFFFEILAPIGAAQLNCSWKKADFFSTAAKEFSLQLRFEKMQTKVSIFSFFSVLFKNQLLSTTHLSINDLRNLSRSWKKTEISDFFQLRIRILRYCGKKKSKTLSRSCFFLKFQIFFQLRLRFFCGCPKNGELYCGKKII